MSDEVDPYEGFTPEQRISAELAKETMDLAAKSYQAGLAEQGIFSHVDPVVEPEPEVEEAEPDVEPVEEEKK